MKLLPTTYALRRLLRQRLVSASVALGIALAVALGVAVPLAVNALAALGLQATLAALPPLGHDIQLIRSGEAFELGFQRRVANALGEMVGETYTAGYSPQLSAQGQREGESYPIILRFQEGLIEHSEVSGKLPEAGPLRAFRGEEPSCERLSPIEALLSERQIQMSGLRVGDRLCIDGRIPLTISASFVPRDTNERYWQGDARPERGVILQGGPSGGDPVYVLIIPREDFIEIGRFFDPTRSVYLYRAAMRTELINLDSVASVTERLRLFRTQITTAQPRPLLITGIDRAITTYNTRFQLLQSGLVTLVLGVITLALVYVVLVGALATEQQSAETAILRSRGASQAQIVGNQVSQALALAVPGLLAGIAFGALLHALIGQTDLFRRLGGSGGLPWRMTSRDALLPLSILLVAVVGLLFSARPALRQSLVTLRQTRARPPGRAGLQQVQADALVLLLALLGWWQLRRYGGTLTTSLDGTPRFNLLILSAPILMLLGGSLLFLRLFPFVVRVLGVALSQRPGIVPALSSWQLARNPRSYGRLVLLLTLTVGLGVYAQATSKTIGREQLRHALETAGSDVRVPLAPETDTEALLQSLPTTAHTFLAGLEANVLVQTGTVQGQQGALTLLGVEGSALSTVLAQSGSTNGELLATLRTMGAGTAPPLGIALPPGATTLGVDAKGVSQDVHVFAKVVGLNGSREVELGTPGTDWQTLQATVPADLEPPLALQSLIARPASGGGGPAVNSLSFDDLQAQVGTQMVMLNDFDRREDWAAARPPSSRATLAAEALTRTGSGSGVSLGFRPLTSERWAALVFNVEATLPVYAAPFPGSAPAATGSTLWLDAGGRKFDVVVQGQIARLPGMDDDRRTLLVAQSKRLEAIVTYGLPTTIAPTELRAALRPGAQFTPPQNAVTKEAALLAELADPLANGVRVILLLGFASAAVLSVVGFLTHAALTLRARELELAVLRAIGLSPRQLLLLIAAEQAFLLSGGLVAGVVVGLILSISTRPFLRVVAGELSATGTAVDWPGLVLLAGSLILALTLALVLLLAAVRRRGMFRALRLGEA